MDNQIKIVVIEGPSGAGKDTLIRQLIELHPDTYVKMPSITDRPMRKDETQGNPYFHVTKEEFEAKIKSGEVFEYTVSSRDGRYRGMNKKIIDDILATDKIQIKDCDWVGIEALRRIYPGKVLAICLHVPKEEIAKRLLERGGDPKDIENRLNDYDEYAQKIAKYCDIIIDNIKLSDCARSIHNIITYNYIS
ncbi:MAG: AAA family ATPase [Firmicutes bacterium]|nr:AAA family ATPase [Bacillota bacterium]